MTPFPAAARRTAGAGSPASGSLREHAFAHGRSRSFTPRRARRSSLSSSASGKRSRPVSPILCFIRNHPRNRPSTPDSRQALLLLAIAPPTPGTTAPTGPPNRALQPHHEPRCPGLLRHPRQSVVGIIRAIRGGIPRNKAGNNNTPASWPRSPSGPACPSGAASLPSPAPLRLGSQSRRRPHRRHRTQATAGPRRRVARRQALP